MRRRVILLIIAILSLISIIYVAQVSARERNNWSYSKRTESLYKAAAYVYYNNEGVFDSKGLTCKPQDITIKYNTNFTDRFAYASEIWGAYKDKVSPDEYCYIVFSSRETRINGCVTFIHEYGHMIGREHNKNIKSPMYDGYAGYKGQKMIDLFNRNNKYILAKSVCSALRIK